MLGPKGVRVPAQTTKKGSRESRSHEAVCTDLPVTANTQVHVCYSKIFTFLLMNHMKPSIVVKSVSASALS